MFDPRVWGADCDRCPLKGRTPVPPKRVSSPLLAVIQEAPEDTDVATQRPLSGRGGELVKKIFEAEKLSLHRAHLSYALLCRPPADINTQELKDALHACHRRLARELVEEKITHVLALGDRVQRVLTGKADLMAWMGPPTQGAVFRDSGTMWKPSKRNAEPPGDAIRFDQIELISTLSPTTCIYESPQYTPVLRKHIRRGWQRATGELADWKWPQIHIDDGEAMRSALWEIYLNDPHVGVDIETPKIKRGDGIKKLAILNVGIAGVNHSVSIDWRTASRATREIALAILADEDISKDFYNMQFDLWVFGSHGIKVAGHSDDWMLAHQIIAPGISHKLTHASCFEFHVERWKTTFHGSTDGEGDKFLDADWQVRSEYNAKDTWVQHQLRSPFLQYLRETYRGVELYENARRNAYIAMEMRLDGVKVCEANREKREKEALAALTKAQETLRNILERDCGIKDFNPNSTPQLKKLFTQTLGITLPLGKTKKPTCDAKALTELVVHTDKSVAAVAHAILMIRKFKRRCDYLRVMKNPQERVHPKWSPGKAKTGRWASSEPNLMNIPKPRKDDPDAGLRDVFEASPGMFMVECDYSALEARILAIIANERRLLEWFAKTKDFDIHTETAALALQKLAKLCKHIEKQTGVECEKKCKLHVTGDERETFKSVRYAFHYGSGPKTAHSVAVLKVPGLKLETVEKLFIALSKLHPDIVLYHRRVVANAKKNDHIECAYSGRRHHFHGQLDINQIKNLPIQMFASALIDDCMRRIRARLRRELGERILMQVHDSLLLEGPDWIRLYRIVKEEMEMPVTINGVTTTFYIDGKWGTNWGQLKEVKEEDLWKWESN